MVYMSQRNFYWIGLALSLITVMINVDFTAVNLALPIISHQLNVNLSVIQWMLSGYMGAWAAIVVLGGKLADIFGAKKIFLIGVALFTISSILVAATNFTLIIILARILQGIGAALFAPACYGIVFTNIPQEKQGQMLGLVGGAVGIGLALGPTLAGIILHLLDWKWIFYINVPIGLLVFGIIARYTNTIVNPNAGSVNLFGAIYLMGLVYLILIAINLFDKQNYGGGISLSLLFIILTVGFIVTQLKSKTPFLELSIFRNKTFSLSVLIYIVFQLLFAGVIFTVGLYLQNILSFSSLKAGYIFLTITLVFGLLSFISGKFLRQANLSHFMLVGIGAILITCVSFIFFSAEINFPFIIVSLVLFGIGLGIIFPAVNTQMMQSLSSSDIGVGAGVFTMFGALANAISVSISSLLLTKVSIASLINRVNNKMMILTQGQMSDLKKLLEHGHYSSIAKTNYNNFISLMNVSYMEAINHLFVLFAFFGFLGLVFIVFLRRLSSKKLG